MRHTFRLGYSRAGALDHLTQIVLERCFNRGARTKALERTLIRHPRPGIQHSAAELAIYFPFETHSEVVGNVVGSLVVWMGQAYEPRPVQSCRAKLKDSLHRLRSQALAPVLLRMSRFREAISVYEPPRVSWRPGLLSPGQRRDG